MSSAETWLALSHPIVVATVGSVLLAIWKHDSQRPHYLLLIGIAYLAYSMGLTLQIISTSLVVPVMNGIPTGSLYMVSVVLLTSGLTRLADRRYQYRFLVLVIGIMLIGHIYFLSVDNDLALRSYPLHLAAVLILMHGTWLTRHLLRGKVAERVLYLSFVALTLCNVPRVLAPLFRPGEHDISAYWLATQVSIYVFSIVLGLALILTVMQKRIVIHRLLSETDALTGLRNRRGFYEAVARWLDRVEVYTVVMLDIDHFKHVNDTHGHNIGDIVLAEAADIIESSIRPYDVSGRIGGEEFAIFLPDTVLIDGHQVAERLRQNFEQFTFAKERTNLQCTISLGVATVDARTPLAEALHNADTQLYQAKVTGRNRTSSACFCGQHTMSCSASSHALA